MNIIEYLYTKYNELRTTGIPDFSAAYLEMRLMYVAILLKKTKFNKKKNVDLTNLPTNPWCKQKKTAIDWISRPSISTADLILYLLGH